MYVQHDFISEEVYSGTSLQGAKFTFTEATLCKIVQIIILITLLSLTVCKNKA